MQTRFIDSIRRVAAVLTISVALWAAFFAFVSAESITSFKADIVIRENGVMQVTETIVYDFERNQRRGIYRNILDTHAQPGSVWYKEKYLEYDVLSVTRNGQTEPFIMQDYDGLSVRIGDPNVYHTGAHTYTIMYEVSGGVSVYPDFEELYWNVTGDEWDVPISDLTVSLSTAEGVSFGDHVACYSGVVGEVDSCDITTTSNQVLFSHDRLLPGEQLTVAQSLVFTTSPEPLERFAAWWLVFVVAGFLMLTALGALIYRGYRWRTEFKPDQPIIVQYEPYEDFKPMFTGVLFDNSLDPKDISAGIVYLAEQGFLTITKTTKKVVWLFDVDDYEVTLKRPPAETETHFHQTLLGLLYKSSMPRAGDSVMLSKLSKDQAKKRQNYKEIQALKKAIKEDLVSRGYLLEPSGRVFLSSIGAFGLLVLVLVAIFGVGGFIALVFLGIVGLALFLQPRYSKKGYEAQFYLEGFKDFLATTEAERYKFHNAPSKSPEQFMEYLPYAIAFGVEKEWAEVFKDIELASPDWYSASDGSSFNPTVFASDIGAFSSSFSSSSGSSGSSGGGSAGGGSGGGGGGSW